MPRHEQGTGRHETCNSQRDSVALDVVGRHFEPLQAASTAARAIMATSALGCLVSEASGIEGEPAQDERGIRELPSCAETYAGIPYCVAFLICTQHDIAGDGYG